MKLICKLLHQNPDDREGVIVATSLLGIVVNAFIATLKIVIGVLASSIAIISEGVNNATDALTSVLTLLGTKLAGKKPDEKHPFGYGRIEYLTGLVVSVLILVTSTEMLISAVKSIFNPAEMEISYLSIGIVAVSAIIKVLLGTFTINTGRKVGSSALEGVGLECRGDAIISVVTIGVAILYLLTNFSIDAYAGVFTSLLIMKTGIDVLIQTINDLLGRPGEKKLADKLYKIIRSTPGVLAAADMMLHNYGPDAYSGSVNIEVDHEKTIGEVYQVIHELQLKIMHEMNVTMVFGLYAVDRDHQEIKEMRTRIGEFVKTTDHVKSFHALYLEPESNKIYCDLIVDYRLKDWDALRTKFLNYLKQFYPNNDVELVIETEFV